MTRGLVILVGALLLTPLRAVEKNRLFKACKEMDIVMVVQTWTPDRLLLRNHDSGRLPGFPDSVMDVFAANYPSKELRVEALIKALAEPLAGQGFHIFRIDGVLWIAPQEAPPLFSASVHVAERQNYSVAAFLEALATACDSQAPPVPPNVIVLNNGRVFPMKPPREFPFDAGDWSLARALRHLAEADAEVAGWTLSCCDAAEGSGKKYFFRVTPTDKRSPEFRFPKIARENAVRDLLLRFDEAHPQKKW